MIACRRTVATSALVAALLCGMAIEALAQRCQPRRALARIVLTTLGPCEFDPETLHFAGDAEHQAKCLMRSATAKRNLGAHLESLPPPLASRLGQQSPLPDREALATHLAELGLVWDYAPFLWQPLSRARNNDPEAPQARYFVIHDTSGPNFGRRPFPVNLDEHRGINNLGRHRCSDGWEPAHVIINRAGAMLLGHELSEPWRATRFERATRFGTDLKGLFLHVELVQPRRSQPGRGRRNDAIAPTPGFSEIQYDRLALIYTIASVRAGRWLVPAFHIAIDSGIRGGHDDPQNFEIATFAASIARLAKQLERLVEPAVAEARIAPPIETPVVAEQPEPAAATPPVEEAPEPAIETSAAEPTPAPQAEQPPAQEAEEMVVAEQRPEPAAEPTAVPAAQTQVAPITQDQLAERQVTQNVEPAAGPPITARSGDGASHLASPIGLNFVPEMFLLFPLGCAILVTRGRDKHGPAGRDGRV
jgi:hypothetical protein